MHLLWVDIGFGIAVAVFAAMLVIGQQIDAAPFAALMAGYLVVFVAFTAAAEAAAARAEREQASSAASHVRSPRRPAHTIR